LLPKLFSPLIDYFILDKITQDQESIALKIAYLF